MSIVRCLSCDALSNQAPNVKTGQTSFCPCCQDKLGKPNYLSLSGELALAIAATLFFIPAQYFNLVTINLIGAEISTTVSSGAMDVFINFPIVSILVLFCTFVAPLGYLIAIFLAHSALWLSSHRLLSVATHLIRQLRKWVMIDVFLVSLAIASFKVGEVAKVVPKPGLICFILLHLTLTILLSRLSRRRYWNHLSPAEKFDIHLDKTDYTNSLTCPHCNLTQNNTHTHCLRCSRIISSRKKHSLQRTWACLITAIIFIFPANFYSISILLKNGKRIEDTIMSGVTSLITEGTYGIAAIIFTASIIVPIAKIIGLVYILCCIHKKYHHHFNFRAKLYRFVHIIGKWSMMDLFVITIMISLINRGNILGFAPGMAATAFGLVVIFTMLATESLDPRLIWDTGDQQRLAKYFRQKIK